MMSTQPGTKSDRLVIYPSKAKLVLMLLGCLMFVAMVVWIGSSPRFAGFARWKIFVSAYLGVPSFGAVGVFAALRLVRPKAALELDDIGITDNASAVGAGHLRWAEIDHLVLYRFLGQPLLGIVPVNLSQITLRKGLVCKAVARMNLSLGLPPFNIPQNVLPIKLSDLCSMIEQRYGVQVVSPDA